MKRGERKRRRDWKVSRGAVILRTEWFAKNSITVIPAKAGAEGLRSASIAHLAE